MYYFSASDEISDEKRNCTDPGYSLATTDFYQQFPVPIWLEYESCFTEHNILLFISYCR